MNNYCEDCGCRVYGGICSNCQEELYIFNYQEMNEPSQEFMEAVHDQQIKNNRDYWF